MLSFGKGTTDIFDLFVSSQHSTKKQKQKSIVLCVFGELSSVKGSYSGKIQLPGHRMVKINCGGLDAGCGLEICNANEASQVKSLVRQSRRWQAQRVGRN